MFDMTSEVVATSDLSPETIRSRFKWDKPIEITVCRFLQKYYSYLNNDPSFQRDDCVVNPNGSSKQSSKYQKIINSIFSYRNIGQIQLILVKGLGIIYDHETLDGAHRIRAIHKFRHGKFKIHNDCPVPQLRGKYYHDLTEEYRQIFEQYPLQLLVYNGMTPQEKGEQFRIANAGDPVLPMEKLNTFHPNIVGDHITGLVKKPETVARLFEVSSRVNGAGIRIDKGMRLKFTNKHMCYQEHAARILCMIWQGDIQTPKKACYGIVGPCNHGDNGMLTKMYEAADRGEITNIDMDRMSKKLKTCLDFLADIADARCKVRKNEGLATHELTLLSRWFMHYTNYHGPFKLNDPIKFYESFYNSLLNFMGTDSKSLYDGRHDERLIADKKGAFIGMLSEWKVKDDMILPVLWLMNEGKFDPESEGSITVLDRKRCFSRKEIDEKLARQGYTCAISGAPLSAADARGAHIEPWSEGGKTNSDNFMVVHKDHNAKMSTMNAIEYRKIWLSKNSNPNNQISIDIL